MKEKIYTRYCRPRSGEVLLLTIFALGTAMLGATTIAGLLMVYQIRQSTDVANSAKAIFAADAGLEWALFESYKVSSTEPPLPAPTFSNGASVVLTCYDAALMPLSSCEKPDPDQPSPVKVIRSVGKSGTSYRAFSLGI